MAEQLLDFAVGLDHGLRALAVPHRVFALVVGDAVGTDTVGALRRAASLRAPAIGSAVGSRTSGVPQRPVDDEQRRKVLMERVNATPLPCFHTTGHILHAAFRGTNNPDTNKIPK